MEVRKALVIEKLNSLSALRNFSCGVAQMDQFIHSGLQASIDNHYCKAYCVRIEGEVVAVFALSYDSIDLDPDDKGELLDGISITSTPHLTPEYIDTFYGKLRYPALDIAYLAVQERWRGKGIGEAIVLEIEEKTRMQDFAGCQFLSVEALSTKDYTAVGFYYKCGFAPNEYPNPSKDTLRMYKTLYAAENIEV